MGLNIKDLILEDPATTANTPAAPASPSPSEAPKVDPAPIAAATHSN